MIIADHELANTSDDDPIKVSHVRGKAGRPITPELVVIHYAVTDSLDATVRTQQARGYWAHLSVDGFSDGQRSEMRAVQQVPFNRRASHAGQSSWRGRERVNDFGIGIEIANPGPLLEGADGKLRRVYGKIWPQDDAQHTGSAPGYPKAWKWWAKYSTEEMAILVTICRMLRAEYGITEIVGHSDISPGRKFDPGPAMDLAWLRQSVFDGKQYALS